VSAKPDGAKTKLLIAGVAISLNVATIKVIPQMLNTLNNIFISDKNTYTK
jgi:hypothetical protein